MAFKIGSGSKNAGGAGGDLPKWKKNFYVPNTEKLGKDGKKVGALRARVLPPLGELADQGRWGMLVYHRWHEGFEFVTKAGKKLRRPFLCLRKKNKSDGTFTYCRMCAEIERRLDERAKAKAAYIAEKGLTPEQAESDAGLETYLSPFNMWLGQFNRGFHPSEAFTKINTGGGFFCNVKTVDGQFGALQVNMGVKDQLYVLLDEAEAEGDSLVDLANAAGEPTGYFLDFAKTAAGASVVLARVQVAGQKKGVTEPIAAPITEEDLTKIEAECWDLRKMHPRLSNAEIEKLIAANGDPRVVGQVFMDYQKAEAAADSTKGSGVAAEGAPASDMPDEPWEPPAEEYAPTVGAPAAPAAPVTPPAPEPVKAVETPEPTPAPVTPPTAPPAAEAPPPKATAKPTTNAQAEYLKSLRARKTPAAPKATPKA